MNAEIVVLIVVMTIINTFGGIRFYKNLAEGNPSGFSGGGVLKNIMVAIGYLIISAGILVAFITYKVIEGIREDQQSQEDASNTP